MRIMFSLFIFFFSSRRRHTRWNCDWSSDVCSSDLGFSLLTIPAFATDNYKMTATASTSSGKSRQYVLDDGVTTVIWLPRSEERRVGKSVDLGGRRVIKKKIYYKVRVEVE